MDLITAAAKIESFAGSSLTQRIASIEASLSGAVGREIQVTAPDVDVELLVSAALLKKAAGQINVLIHATGILLALPYILEEGETVESLSLGAGNTGKAFDLETNRRVAEFKFIQWRGGSESIRQNSIFQDFFHLAEADTQKRRVLYLLELERPLKFFMGGRSLASVMSKSRTLRHQFRAKYEERFSKVSEYYTHRQANVEIVNLITVVPSLKEQLKYGL